MLNPTYVTTHAGELPDSCKCDHNSTNHQCEALLNTDYWKQVKPMLQCVLCLYEIIIIVSGQQNSSFQY